MSLHCPDVNNNLRYFLFFRILLLQFAITAPITLLMGTTKSNVVQIEKFFYARKEAAYALAVSVRSIDYLISDGKLRTRRKGRRVLIPSEDVKKVAAEIMRSDMLIGA